MNTAEWAVRVRAGAIEICFEEWRGWQREAPPREPADEQQERGVASAMLWTTAAELIEPSATS